MPFRIVEFTTNWSEPSKKNRTEHLEAWESRDMAQLAAVMMGLARTRPATFEVEPITAEPAAEPVPEKSLIGRLMGGRNG